MPGRKTMLVVVAVGLCVALWLGSVRPKINEVDRVPTMADKTRSTQDRRASPVDTLSRRSSRSPTSDSVDGQGQSLQTMRFENASRCIVGFRQRALMERQLEVCKKNLAASGADNDFARSCVSKGARFSERFKGIETANKRCEDVDGQAAEERFFASTILAARNGDPAAQICFVGARFFVDRPWTAAETDEYQTVAKQYSDAAISRGDWAIVELMAATSERMLVAAPQIAALTNGRDETRYEMNRLLRLGTDDPTYARYLDEIHADMGSTMEEPIRVAAEARARRTYDRHFRASPRLTEAPQLCGSYKASSVM